MICSFVLYVTLTVCAPGAQMDVNPGLIELRQTAIEVVHHEAYEFDPTRVPPGPAPEPEPVPVPAPAPEPEPEPAPEPVQSKSSGIVLTGMARAIADCESGNRLPNGRAVEGSYGSNLYNTQGSTASGLFHFLDGTWQWIAGEIGAGQYARAVHAPESVQLEAFEYLYAGGAGAHHWDASRSCWG